MLHLAGRRHWYAARLQHVGRRSGRSYATPSSRDRCPAASPSRSPTGETSTGTATWRPPATGVLAVHGTRYTITAPRTVLSAEVTGTLPPYWRRMLHGVAEYLVVRAEPADVHPVLPAGTGRSG